MPSLRDISFRRIVEVFPPNLKTNTVKPDLELPGILDAFVEGVRGIKHVADTVMVADLKDPGRAKVSPVQAAAMLKERLGVDAMPVINARDSNRLAVSTSVLTAFSLGLTRLMLVWGDRFPKESGLSNVYNYVALSDMIADAGRLASMARVSSEFCAPVDLSRLATERGMSLARSRLSAGATFLLAQPPTTDEATLETHERILRECRLSDKVLPCVFPFRSSEDILRCRSLFDWDLPKALLDRAKEGEDALMSEARAVARAIQRRGFPGVYLSTRGHPEVALKILG